MTSALTLSVSLTDDDLDALAERVATILAARSMDAAPAGDHLAVPAAAALLGVSPKTVRNYLASGRLTRHGAPRRPLVARVEVEAMARGEARARPAERVRRPSRARPAERTFTARARGE